MKVSPKQIRKVLMFSEVLKKLIENMFKPDRPTSV